MNKKKNKLIPELRFPEFKNEREWGEKNLEDITNSENSSLALNKMEHKENGFPVYGADSIVGYTDEYQQEEEYISIVKDGSGVGRLNLSQSKSSILGTLTCIKSKDLKRFNLYWIYYLMNTIDFTSYKKGSGIPHIYYSDFKKEKVAIPTLEEQQKIASCLSSLDEVIELHSQKLELLKDHKKGLMQNLFPQEGKKIPKYRFKEFEKDGEWVDSTVEANCDVKGRIGYRGYTTKDIVENGNGALVLGGKHIKDQSINLVDPTFLSWDKYYESPEIMVEINDIIFSQRGTLGDCAIIEKEIGKATINPSMVLLKSIACNPKFLYYVLISETIQKEVGKQKGMGAIPMLSQKQIREFHFRIPRPKEQQKIASVLSSLDDLIMAQTEKIEQLKEHKKGLMQGLFPKMND